jgi:hypothetical protein
MDCFLVEEILAKMYQEKGLKELANAACDETEEEPTTNLLYSKADGQIYEGELFDECPHGYGSLTMPNGTKYIGQFFAGRCHGKITIKFTNGTIVSGTCFDGSYHGEMTFMYPCGTWIRATFSSGKLEMNLNARPLNIFHHEYSCKKCNCEEGKNRSSSDFQEIEQIRSTFETRRMSLLKPKITQNKRSVKKTRIHRDAKYLIQ